MARKFTHTRARARERALESCCVCHSRYRVAAKELREAAVRAGPQLLLLLYPYKQLTATQLLQATAVASHSRG